MYRSTAQNGCSVRSSSPQSIGQSQNSCLANETSNYEDIVDSCNESRRYRNTFFFPRALFPPTIFANKPPLSSKLTLNCSYERWRACVNLRTKLTNFCFHEYGLTKNDVSYVVRKVCESRPWIATVYTRENKPRITQSTAYVSRELLV